MAAIGRSDERGYTLPSLVSKAFGLNASSRMTQKGCRKLIGQNHPSLPPRCIQHLGVIYWYCRAIRCEAHFKVHLKPTWDQPQLLHHLLCIGPLWTGRSPTPQDGLWPALDHHLQEQGESSRTRQLGMAGGGNKGQENRSVKSQAWKRIRKWPPRRNKEGKMPRNG